MTNKLNDVLKTLSDIDDLWRRDAANKGKSPESDEEREERQNRLFSFLMGDEPYAQAESPEGQQPEESPTDGQPTIDDYDDLRAELEISEAAKEDVEKSLEMVEDRFDEQVRRRIRLERELQEVRQLEDLRQALQHERVEPASDDDTLFARERRAHEMLRAKLGSYENQCDQALKYTHGNDGHQVRVLRQALQSLRDKLRNHAL